ncbi:MAG: sigma-70 family RNA polymerase sigma factor [Ruminococcaceae bacterium]|nr:sigma-70 family RNA polymerase sigma factor [Oscillospiraceae bacterium]
MTDHELVALFLERSEQAINELMNRYGTAARHIAANILKDPQDAEECVSEACLQMWNSVPPSQPEHPGAYFCAITRNVCLSRHHANTARKRNSFYDTALDELGDTVPALSDVETEADARRLTEQLNRFLEQLDGDSRYLFLRRYWHGDSVTAIARQSGTSPHAVSVRLHRIRQKLQKFLQKEGFQT